MVNVDMIGREAAGQISCWDQAKPGGTNLFHELHDLDGLGFAKLDHDKLERVSRVAFRHVMSAAGHP